MVEIKKNIEYVFGHWKIDGEYYTETTKVGKLVLKHVNKIKISKRIDTASAIANKLKNKLDAHKVLMEAICKLKDRDIEKLYDLLFDSDRNYGIVTRSHHCVDMKIGNYILPIVE